MPPIRNRKGAIEETDDDDMPPLVDNPNPSTTFTFFSDLSPQSFPGFGSSQTTLATIATTTSSEMIQLTSTSAVLSPPPSPLTPEEQAMPSPVLAPKTTRGHGKKRDASYIPRPPNAFILFRSSFIRSQQIPEKVEGNHSNLSRIIGHYWRSLSPEERADWEAKAVIAQEEHRRMYPDWRFRPGPYAMARLKTKDGGASTRRRSTVSRTKDPPDGGSGGQGGEMGDGMAPAGVSAKGKGKERANKKPGCKDQAESRCEMIANLIVEGKTGTVLASAVEEWEGRKKKGRSKARLTQPTMEPSPISLGNVASIGSDLVKHRGNHGPSVESSSPDGLHQRDASSSSALSPDGGEEGASASTDPMIVSQVPKGKQDPKATIEKGLSNVPLTHMYRRSLSSPTLPRPSQSPRTANLPSPEENWGSGRSSEHQPDHLQGRRNTFPVQPSHLSYDYTQNPWEAEGIRREYHTPVDRQSYWWNSQSEADDVVDSPTHDQAKKAHDTISMPSTEMGYEMGGAVEDFDRSYAEQYGTMIEPPLDGSESTNWSTHANRQGFLSVIDDPYMHSEDDGDSSDPIPPPTVANPPATFLENSSPPTISVIPPQTHLIHTPYYEPISPLTPSNLPSSSFSTLTGWAGDYKYNSPTQGQSRAPTFDAIRSDSWHTDPGWQPSHRVSAGVDRDEWDRTEDGGTTGLRSNANPP